MDVHNTYVNKKRVENNILQKQLQHNNRSQWDYLLTDQEMQWKDLVCRTHNKPDKPQTNQSQSFYKESQEFQNVLSL